MYKFVLIGRPYIRQKTPHVNPISLKNLSFSYFSKISLKLVLFERV